jgi:hypothetical protein
MRKVLVLGFIIFIFFSCGTMEKNDRIVRRKDFFNRFSKKELIAYSGWKMGVDKLLLRKNKTFRIYSNVFGIVNSGYYSGTYKISNDTLKLKYLNNHKLEFDELCFALDGNYPILKCEMKTFYIEQNSIFYTKN